MLIYNSVNVGRSLVYILKGNLHGSILSLYPNDFDVTCGTSHIECCKSFTYNLLNYPKHLILQH